MVKLLTQRILKGHYQAIANDYRSAISNHEVIRNGLQLFRDLDCVCSVGLDLAWVCSVDLEVAFALSPKEGYTQRRST